MTKKLPTNSSRSHNRSPEPSYPTVPAKHYKTHNNNCKPGNACMPTWTTSTSSFPPHRVETAYHTLAHELQQHAHIQLNPAKTRVWNNSGHRPPNVEHLGPEVWVGARDLPPEQQGITLLGTPLGTPAFQATHLQATADQHSTLLERIPAIQDLQAEWLLLLYCASPRCNYLLRMLRPEITQPFCPSPRHSHHPRPRPTSGHEGPCAHSLGNRTPPTTPWRAWTHQRLSSQPLRLLGFLG